MVHHVVHGVVELDNSSLTYVAIYRLPSTNTPKPFKS